MTRNYIHKYNGLGLKVKDKEIIDASKQLAKQFGLFVEPAAAAAYAGLLKYKESGHISRNEQLVVLLTGNGLKDIEAVSGTLDIPEAIDAKSFNFDSFD